MIKRNFSRCAHLYDKYANIQRLVASELVKELPNNGIANILEIGCGTGNYTSLLKEKFKSSRIKALDIAKGMIGVARQKLKDRQIEFLVTDAENIDINNEFGLITSNAAFQWFERIERTIEKFKKALKKEGIIAFSIFGPLTFWELNQSLKEVLHKDVSIGSHIFLEKEKLEIILSKYFHKIYARELIVKERYVSLMELLRKIKYTGIRGAGLNSSFAWTQKLLKRTEETYKCKFGQIEATYQIFFCRAIK